LAEVVFSSWGGKVIDNRQGGEPEAAAFKLPGNYLDEGNIGAFMGWDGVIVLDKDVDIVTMAAEYMKRVQEKYCCAKCTPGKRGTRVMMDTLARILAGHGEESGTP
jgi:formate dehydrogenase beta subunit